VRYLVPVRRSFTSVASRRFRTQELVTPRMEHCQDRLETLRTRVQLHLGADPREEIVRPAEIRGMVARAGAGRFLVRCYVARGSPMGGQSGGELSWVSFIGVG
jgi:hypothetical protein